MIKDLFTQEKAFRNHLIQRLRLSDVDFPEQMNLIQDKQRKGERWSASGILLLLEYDKREKEWVIVLNKRSTYVQQPGDLCCPGGGTGNRTDRILGCLLNRILLPSSFSKSFRILREVPESEKGTMGMVIAAVLREGWEEMRLPPWRVEYLGGLRSHRLHSFPKIIFPVVGRTTGRWRARPNWEVEKVVPVPVRSFFDPSNYALLNLIVPPSLNRNDGLGQSELPCLVIGDDDQREILWGATFNIIINFLSIVLDLPLELLQTKNTVEKDLPVHYFTGKPR